MTTSHSIDQLQVKMKQHQPKSIQRALTSAPPSHQPLVNDTIHGAAETANEQSESED